MRPCTVGLTGGLASGKSSVAAALAELGAAVIDADTVVHELYAAGCEGARLVAEHFGADLLDRDGAVDRRALGQRVLADRQALDRLNAVVHPLVRAQIGRWLDAVTAPVAVVEAALLVETGAFRSYDLLAVVYCEPEQQMQRALDRGLVRERAEKILDAQLPLARKTEHADLVINNSGPAADLPAEVQRAWAEINEMCRTPPATRSDTPR